MNRERSTPMLSFIIPRDFPAGTTIHIPMPTNGSVPQDILIVPPPRINWNAYNDALPRDPLQSPVVRLIDSVEFNRPSDPERSERPTTQENRQATGDPLRGVPAPDYLLDRLGSNWQVRRRREAEDILHNATLYHRHWHELFTFDHMTGNAGNAFVTPTLSVRAFWYYKGNTLQHPELPLLVQLGGVRGTGRIGRQARAAGRAVWLEGQLHRDFIPLEHILVMDGDSSPSDGDFKACSATSTIENR